MKRGHVAIAAVVMLLLAGCGDNGSNEGTAQESTEVIKLGVAIAQTGRLSEPADSMIKGYELWAEQVNEDGGIDGRQVELVIQDDESNPDTARLLAERMIQQDDVALLLGPYGSGSTAAMAVAAERAKVPLLGSIASDTSIWTEQDWNYLFQAYAGAQTDHQAFFELVADQGVKKIALVTENASFTKLGKDAAVSEYAPEHGLQVDAFEWSEKDLDFSSVVQRVADGDYQAVSVMGYLPGILGFGQTMIERGVQVDAVMLGTPDEAMEKDLGQSLNGVFGRTPWHASQETEGNADFVSSYEEAYGAEPDYQAATAFASGQLVKAAIEEVGTDREALAQFFASEQVDTVLGTYEVNDSGAQVGYSNVLAQYQPDLSVVVVQGEGAAKEPVWPKPAW